MAGHDGRASKRRKLQDEWQHPDGDIRGAFELHNLLRFKQSTEPDVKTGIERFRSFLVDIANQKDPSERTVLLKVLKQYCDDQSSSSKNEVDFSDLLSTWSFAAQNNADSILSAVPAALAQFFRTISNELDFREFGLSLCHSLLKTDQVRLLDRGLSAPKHKDFLISPCLRLTTELMSFDAGIMAANVFSRRDILLKRLDVLMDPLPRHGEQTDRRRPSVRRNAQRLLLAMLRYLDNEAKSELITQGKVLYSCVRNLSLDGGDIVRDILKTFRLSLISDDLQRLTKTRFLNAGNLQLFAQLYDFPEEDIDVDASVTPVRQAAHEFLGHVCTTGSGALIPHSGWYPPNYELSDVPDSDDDSGIDLGLNSPYYSDDFTINVPVRNTNLSMFLQKLAPATDVLQAELIIKIFVAAPELVADYFCKRPKSIGAPADDNSWVGQLGFLYSAVDLPVPPNLAEDRPHSSTPPPVSVMIENILPRPLDRAALTAFLKKNEDLTVISACRIMTIALAKARSLFTTSKAATTRQSLWLQTATKLSGLISERVPLYQEIVTALQKTAKDNHEVRGTILECMALYKQVLPQATVSSTFDVGPALLDVLQLLQDPELSSSIQDALQKQDIALTTIAGLSRGTKWWHKPGSQQLCPVMQLLCSLDKASGGVRTAVRETLHPVLIEKGVIRSDKAAWKALETSVSAASQTADRTVLDFVENCMIRTTKQPVKYLELLEEAQKITSDATPVSLLACAIAEQWPHFLKNEHLRPTADFVSELFARFSEAGENAAVLEHFRKQMMEASADYKKHRKTLKKAFERTKDEYDSGALRAEQAESLSPAKETPADSAAQPTPPANIFPQPQPLPTSYKPLPGSYNLESDLSTSPSSSRLATLMRSLSSTISEIRLGALSTLSSLLTTLPNSTYSEATQLHMLLGELVETSRQHAISNPSTPQLPSLVTAMATLVCLNTITDPADSMYSKINHFLLRAPHWLPLTRLLPYWTTQILLSEPESGGDAAPGAANDTELLRFLTALAEGIRGPDDVELCRRAALWERLGSVYLRPGCKREVRKGVLRVFWVTAGVSGAGVGVGARARAGSEAGAGVGADTLITRVGVRAWLDVVSGKERGEMRSMVEEVRKKVEEGCDREYIERWEIGVSTKSSRDVRRHDGSRATHAHVAGLGLAA